MTVSPNEKVNFCTYITITNLKKNKTPKLKIKYHFGKYFVGLVFQKSQKKNSYKLHKLHVKCG